MKLKHLIGLTRILFFIVLFNFQISQAIQTQPDENQGLGSSDVHFQRRLIYDLGLYSSHIEGKNSSNFSNLRNVHIGVSLDWLGNEKSVFEIGVKYRNLALSSEFAGTDSIKVDYLLLGANYKYYYSGHHENSVFGKLGLLNAIAANHQQLRTTISTTEKVNSWENSIWVSVGYKIDLDPKYSLYVEGGWNQALQSLFENTDVVRHDLLAVIGLGVSR